MEMLQFSQEDLDTLQQVGWVEVNEQVYLYNPTDGSVRALPQNVVTNVENETSQATQNATAQRPIKKRGSGRMEMDVGNTKYLILRYFELLPRMKSDHWRLKRIYDEVSREMNALPGNETAGVRFTPKQVGDRMEYLLGKYKDLIVYNGKTGRNGELWEWWDELDPHMHERPIANTKNVISSFDDSVPTRPSTSSTPLTSVFTSTNASVAQEDSILSVELEVRPKAPRTSKSTSKTSDVLLFLQHQEESAKKRDDARMEFLKESQTQILGICSSLATAFNRLVDKL